MVTCSAVVFPNSWVWTWRSWKKLKKMLGWEMEAWAGWQVMQGEGSPLLVQGAWGPRVAWLSHPHCWHLPHRPSAVWYPSACSWLAGNIPSPPRAARSCRCVFRSAAGRAAAGRGCLEPFSSPPREISHFSEALNSSHTGRLLAAILVCLSRGTAGDESSPVWSKCWG